MLVDTSAIVFKTVNFRESSLIVTLLSKRHGKMSVMARGAKRKKNKYGGLLQPGSVLEVTYYYKTSRSIQNLSDINQKYPTWRIHQEMEKMAIGLVTLELCEQLCHEYEPMPEVFEFLSHFLLWLHETEASPRNLFPYIQFRLAGLSGIGITWDLPESSLNDDEPEHNTICYLNVQSGRLSNTPDDELHFFITKSQLHYLRCIIHNRKTLLLTEPFPAGEIKNLIYHMDVYFQYHIEGIKARRSDAVFEQIL